MSLTSGRSRTSRSSALSNGRALRRLASDARVVTLRGGDYLFHSGDAADRLYVVRAGRLRVLVDSEEGPRVVRELGPGDVLGELALLTGSPRSASAQAVRDSELLSLEAGRFDALLADDPEFARALLRELARQLQASGGLAAPSTRPSVFSVVPLAGDVDADRLASAIGGELARFGSVDTLRGDEGSDGYAALLARAEAANDAVVLVAAGADAEWDAFCRRQADRTVLLAGPDTPVGGAAAGCDLVLLAPMPAGRTLRWLEQVEPAAHHLVYEAAYDLGAARVARRIAGRSLGLVLSGGGARGFAHIGAIAAITEAGHQIDRLGGCSMGAFIGAMAALGLETGQIRDRCHDELVRKTPFNDWTVPRVAPHPLARRPGCSNASSKLQVEELPRSLFTVSADLLSSRTVVHRRGPLVEAVGASMSIPGARPAARARRQAARRRRRPQQPAGRPDGRQPRRAGDRDRRRSTARARERTETPPLPSIMETMTRATVLGSVERAERNRSLAALVISPDVQDVGLREFSALDRAVAAGPRRRGGRARRPEALRTRL